MRYLISGGGTGGHIFPAISIANALRELDPEADILFVGALGRMEMERVPQAGYSIVGLPIRGFDRQHWLRNIGIMFDLLRSLHRARGIIRSFRPDVAVGVGGYASGAAMKVAAWMKIPIVLQEQNGFAGVTNKLLRNDAERICVAYEGMEKFFPKDKLILTGNPVRQNLVDGQRVETGRKTLLVIGGSLGARTLNEALMAHLDQLLCAGVDIVWQTGKLYYDHCMQFVQEKINKKGLSILPFLSDMPDRYAQADLVISRAGASSISEICMLGKASVLVPSPNVAEDHQTHNAMALVNRHAAVLVKDTDAKEHLIDTALTLLQDDEQLQTLGRNARAMAQNGSAERIAREVIALAKNTESPKTR